MTANWASRLPDGRSVVRVLGFAFAVVLALTVLSAGHSMLTHDPVATGATVEDGNRDAGNATPSGTSSMESPDPRVVATVDGVGPGQILAYDANGSVVYHNDSWWIYHDVDPSPEGKHTVTYVASGTADSGECDGKKCLRNAIERLNLTTGEVERLHGWVDPRRGSTQTHDVDRINESVYLVADISYPDRVYMVNVTSGEEIWEWRVSEAFESESGGDYPSDWTHINDVEYLPDGRVMANLRNQDQVVFIDPGEGIQHDWTLGTDDDHETLFEPHNPDYIPRDRGGPAIVIADSENNRLVEYQRTDGCAASDDNSSSTEECDGTWERSWHWQDTRMQWPRDADRLPSGRTLVADSHGQRIMSVSEDGSIAWSESFPTGSYDVEVLGTGDESAGGTSAAELGLASRRPGSAVMDGDTSMKGTAVGPSVDDGSDGSNLSDGVDESDETNGTGNSSASSTQSGRDLDTTVSVLVHRVLSLVPPLLLHGLLFTLPNWATPVDAVLVLATLVVGLGWLATGVGVRLYPRIRARRE